MDGNAAGPKQPYEKPELVPIDLQAEEVLAVGCKTASPTEAVGQPNCGLNACNQHGS